MPCSQEGFGHVTFYALNEHFVNLTLRSLEKSPSGNRLCRAAQSIFQLQANLLMPFGKQAVL